VVVPGEGGLMSIAVMVKRDVACRAERMDVPRKPQPPVTRMLVWDMGG